MSEEAKWYVIHTYSGYENKVAATIEKTVANLALSDLIQGVMIPIEKVTEINKDGEQREVERKVFPGYVLVKMVMNDETWHIIRNVRGVTSFVGPGSKPVPLTEREVEQWGAEKREIKVDYKVGDTVRVSDGPLEGFIGIVEEISLEKDRVRVTVSMFGRETSVELELSQVEVEH
jgi:transcriptional antiterminator NusG